MSSRNCRKRCQIFSKLIKAAINVIILVSWLWTLNKFRTFTLCFFVEFEQVNVYCFSISMYSPMCWWQRDPKQSKKFQSLNFYFLKNARRYWLLIQWLLLICYRQYNWCCPRYWKKRSLPSRISSVRVTKFARIHGSVLIMSHLLKKSLREFVQCKLWFNLSKRCKLCWELTIKTPERLHLQQ